MPETSSDRLFHLGYVSTETGDLGSSGMVELLKEARLTNTSRNITGLLLHRDRSFYQVLEGSEDVVRETFEGIEKDERHTAIDVLFEGAVEEREFPDWQMGFLNLDDVDIAALRGYSDFLTREDNARDFLENLSRGKRLALMFRSME
ncbi:MAG: blue light sensor protein [Gammaproteobacteria bacterium]|nr:blue light sensor protein [Gammaproteobacteria bacterium]